MKQYTIQSSKGKGNTHKYTDKISQQPENWENRNDPDLVQAFPKTHCLYLLFFIPTVISVDMVFITSLL